MLTALALVFVAIGFWEYHTRHLLLNPKVIADNQFAPYFRVNSLFFDPNIFGRFLVVVMIGVTGVVLWTRERRVTIGGAVVLAILWGGLVLTLSQSSFGALLVGLVVLGALRWSVKWALVAAAATLAVGAVLVIAAPSQLRLHLGDSKSADTATSGRYDLIKGGADLFAARPVGGYGAGSFAREFRHHDRSSTEKAVSASHTIPLTVAAEQGDGRDPAVRRGARVRVHRAVPRCPRVARAGGRRRGVRRARLPHAAVRRVPGGPADVGAARARRRTAMSARRSEPVAFAALGFAAVIAFLATRTVPSYDSYYNLIWGRDLIHLRSPDFQVYQAPTHHPLYVAVGAVLSVFGSVADRLLVLVCVLAFVALVWATYRVGAAVFEPWAGVVAAALVLVSPTLLLYTARAYVDVPFVALRDVGGGGRGGARHARDRGS